MIVRTLVKFFLFVAAVGAVACQSYPVSYKGEASSSVTQSTFTVKQSSKTDILFVIDNSGSMGEKQQNLRNNTAAFIAELAKSPTSYHLGVLTTDIYLDTDHGLLRKVNGTDGSNFWTSADPNAADAQAQRDQIVAGFNATVESLGIEGSSNEAALEAALKALTDPSVSTHNSGFLREDADLAIIVLSDEDDCSPLTQNYDLVKSWNTDDACYQQAMQSNLVPPGAMVDLLAQVKGGNVSRVRVGMITGGIRDAKGDFVARGCAIAANGNATDNCGCWANSSPDTSPFFCSDIAQPSGNACTQRVDASNVACANNTCAVNGVCGPPTCPVTPAKRYVEFMNDLAAARVKEGFSSGTLADSICQSDYHASLVALANDVVLSSCFALPAAAVSPDDIRVTVAHQQANSTQGAPVLLPRYDPQGTTPGACNSCTGDCAQGAWQYQGSRSVCLACGASKNLGDQFNISVQSGLSGDPNHLP